jgi:hypothetical protein
MGNTFGQKPSFKEQNGKLLKQNTALLGVKLFLWRLHNNNVLNMFINKLCNSAHRTRCLSSLSIGFMLRSTLIFEIGMLYVFLADKGKDGLVWLLL